jgi:pimeloyl-ACP methyl ester carboxylesterase
MTVARTVTALALLLVAAGPTLARESASVDTWTGTYTLHGRDAVSVTVTDRRALVALGAGHADTQTVPVTLRRGRIRFALPGRPASLLFTGRLRPRRIDGTVVQGGARGSFHLRPGAAPGLLARGFYAGPTPVAVVDDPYGPARLVDLDSGEVHGLYPSGKGFQIGAGFATRVPAAGAARFDAAAAVLPRGRAVRQTVRQLEVRFRSGSATLAGTLTLPDRPGPSPAVAFVHGSGSTTRAYLPDLQALLVRCGVAVLAYDKRGTGQSGGTYPGESPTSEAIDVLAKDAEAAVRFLAAQPEIDDAGVGLAGHSQAGWIMPLAASREARVRFLVTFSGPAVTADENDAYQDLAGEGERPAELSDDEIDAEVLRRGPGGVDPIPWIRALRAPALWIYGGRDRHIPPRLSASRLGPIAAEPGRDFTIAVFPGGNHALVETQTGLTAEMLRSSTFAPGMFALVREWLSTRVTRR